MTAEPPRRRATRTHRDIERLLQSVLLRADDLHPKTVAILARAALEDVGEDGRLGDAQTRAKESRPRS